MEVGQGRNWGSSAREKKLELLGFLTSSSLRNVVLSTFQNTGRWTKSENSVMLYTIVRTL
jgi:hypothetical protein